MHTHFLQTCFRKHCKAFEVRIQVQICVTRNYFGNVAGKVSFFKFCRCFAHNILMFLKASVMTEIVGSALCLVHIFPNSLNSSLCLKNVFHMYFSQGSNFYRIEFLGCRRFSFWNFSSIFPFHHDHSLHGKNDILLCLRSEVKYVFVTFLIFIYWFHIVKIPIKKTVPFSLHI